MASNVFAPRAGTGLDMSGLPGFVPPPSGTQSLPTQVGTPQQPTGAPSATNPLATGLAGSVGALEAGAQGSVDALLGSQGLATETINTGANAARTGLAGVAGTVQAGGDQNLGFVNDTFNAGIDPISGFIDNGQNAQNSAANLLGLNGQEAFDASFLDNPGTNFLAEEQERALLRNATATGGVGVGGGRIRQQLQRDAFSRAQTDLQNQITGLTNLSGQGLDAAATAGQLRGNQANIGSNVIGETTGALADVGIVAANLENQTGLSISQIQQQTGVNIAQTLENLGSQSAGVREQAGRDLAAAVESSSGALADLQNTQGSGIADINSGLIANLGNQLTGTAGQRAELGTQLGTLLANLASGQGTNQAALAQNVGNIEAAGIMGNTQLIGDSLNSLSALLGEMSTTTDGGA